MSMSTESETKIAEDQKESEKAEKNTLGTPGDELRLSKSLTLAKEADSSVSSNNPPTPREIRSRSGSVATTEGKRSRKKKSANQVKGGHQVTFTVTIAQAIPNDGSVDDDSQNDKDKDAKRKRRILEAPRVQSFYHCEYFLLPDDTDPVKTDVVTFGMAAKIFTEKQEPKVFKTWHDGDLTWAAWTRCHTVTLTEDILQKFINHNFELRIWDTRDKLSTRAKFDRPKAFKLPSSKDDGENVGGVKALVVKQSRSFEKMQPKRSYIDRPLPMQARFENKSESTDTEKPMSPNKSMQSKSESAGESTGELGSKKGKARKEKQNAQMLGSGGSPGKTVQSGADPEVPESLNTYLQEAGHPAANAAPAKPPSRPPTSGTVMSQEEMPLRSYSRIGKLAAEPTSESLAARNMSAQAGRESGVGSRSRSQPPMGSRQRTNDGGLGGGGGTLSSLKEKLKPDDSDSLVGAPTKPAAARGPRNKKAEAAALAAAEHARKYGICCIPIRMAPFFADIQTLTNRLEKPVPGLEDVFVTVSLNGPLMSEEQRRKLNPLIIKVHSATNMPNTPCPYADLRLRCHPAYIKYHFANEKDHVSIGREHDCNIYWDDIKVVLTGAFEASELREYLNGPALEIEVHDRDRVIERHKLTPTLFGDDLEDEKISNVGTVASKRTMFNPFSGREQSWDPYGVAKFDLSGLLFGQQVLHLKAPIHMCPMPDILGTREGRSDGKLVGVAGAVDGPTDCSMPPGHYLQSHAMMKIKVEIAYPLSTPSQVAAKEGGCSTIQCPFGRIVFRFAYKNIQLLQQLQDAVKELNATALQLNHLPQHVIDAALSTYKLSLEQQRSRQLDIVTGFQVMDGTFHLFVLEGLAEKGVQHLWNALPKDADEDMEVLYNSELTFSERLYGPLDVDLCRIKLHEPLEIIVQQPLLYVRDMVPKPCFQALTKLHQVVKSSKLREAVKNDLFPSAEMVISMSREFGVPLTTEDFEELKPQTEQMESETLRMVDIPRTSRLWTPIDNYNPDYLDQLVDRQQVSNDHDFITENKERVHEVSEDNRAYRIHTAPVTIKSAVQVAHNYSTQALNSTEQAKEGLRQVLAQEPDRRFTMCPEYHHSMTVVPVNVTAIEKEQAKADKARYKTEAGWIYPGKKTMIESNVHPMRPHLARMDDLYQEWEENTLHANVLKPTLKRDRFTWHKRDYDMNVWTRPDPVFGRDEPATIHLAGQKLKDEKLTSIREDYEKWRSKIITADTRVHFHRCATDTEMRSKGFLSSNQLDRLRGLLKDPAQKLALQGPGITMREVPPLNVVLNPSVDTAARLEGRQLEPIPQTPEPPVKGFAPGPFEDKSWNLECNKIPVHDYEHKKYAEKKGHDFNVYHKERSTLHKQAISTLTDREYALPLFRWPPHMATTPGGPKKYYIPDMEAIEAMKTRQKTHETFDSGLGTFINPSKEQTAVEIN